MTRAMSLLHKGCGRKSLPKTRKYSTNSQHLRFRWIVTLQALDDSYKSEEIKKIAAREFSPTCVNLSSSHRSIFFWCHNRIHLSASALRLANLRFVKKVISSELIVNSDRGKVAECLKIPNRTDSSVWLLVNTSFSHAEQTWLRLISVYMSILNIRLNSKTLIHTDAPSGKMYAVPNYYHWRPNRSV